MFDHIATELAGQDEGYRVDFAERLSRGYQVSRSRSRGPRQKAPGLRRCRVCGCTEDNACLVDSVPCSWVEDDLCSACSGTVSS